MKLSHFLFSVKLYPWRDCEQVRPQVVTRLRVLSRHWFAHLSVYLFNVWIVQSTAVSQFAAAQSNAQVWHSSLTRQCPRCLQRGALLLLLHQLLALMMALSRQLCPLNVNTHAPLPWPNSTLPPLPAMAMAHLNATIPPHSHVHAAIQSKSLTRRQALLTGGLLPAFLQLSFPSATPAAVTPARIDFSTAPSRAFDAGDARLREAANLFQEALNASTVEEEEKLWTQVIEKYGNLDAEWVSDIVSRAWGNRGNSRSRQGKMEEALADFDRSIALAPYAADPVLNRGVTLESLGRYEEAAADYQAVLLAQPNDPAAWNNLGNVKAALGEYDEALSNYRRAVQLAPEFSFAAANYALILYQVGKENEASKQFRSLLRRYPEFPDVRAALAVSLYAQGLTAEAETNWGRLEDGRYRDRDWVRYTRKWPPRLVKALEGFLDVKAIAK